MSHYKGDETTGFQSPAQDYIEPVIDLAAVLDLRRPGRYPVRVVGQALRERGILRCAPTHRARRRYPTVQRKCWRVRSQRASG